MPAIDYANLYEVEYRPRGRQRLRNALALTVWGGLFLMRPRLALEIWRERRA